MAGNSCDESVCSMYCSDHKHSFHLHLDDNVSSTENEDEYSFTKTKIEITYNDDSFAFSKCTATTADATNSDASVGNASIASEECFQGEEEKPLYNYKGPKVRPTMTPNTGYNFNHQYNWYIAQ
jgi:hypothetical protein